MDELPRFYVKKVGKRRINRGKNAPHNGKKTWYVAFRSQDGQTVLSDTTIFGALAWKLRKAFTWHRLNTDDNIEE